VGFGGAGVEEAAQVTRSKLRRSADLSDADTPQELCSYFCIELPRGAKAQRVTASIGNSSLRFSRYQNHCRI
jgi:hypothetical protein